MAGRGKEMFINKYDPRLKKYEELEKTFVCGENILKELLESLKPEKNKKLSCQSWILTGPRGAGKSHLLVLLYRKVKDDKTLSKHWHPLSFPEEIFEVDSLYRLLLRILDILFDNFDDPEKLAGTKKQFLELKNTRITGNLKQKKEERHRVAKELLNLLVRIREITGKKLILMLENLQHVFRDQLPEDDLKVLRGFLNENPGVFIIIGTALAVFDQIENYSKPFYHFFRLRSLDSLDRRGIIHFLMKVAEFRGDEDIPGRIETNRHYIYVYQLLTGGNPRLILFLYELLLDNERLDTEMILAKITELTPYFLDKTRDASSQKKLILDALATESPAQTATEIAEYINEEQKSITEQLKRLAAEGWVREIAIAAEGVKPKEVFYTLRDYFYRIWYKVRMKGIDESDIYCMAELAAIIFNRRELEERALKYADRISETQALYEKSLNLSLDENFMRSINILLEESKKLEEKEIFEIYKVLINLIAPNANDWEKSIETFISGVIIEILEVVKNPGTREAQKWMADPLFAEIVKQLRHLKIK